MAEIVKQQDASVCCQQWQQQQLQQNFKYKDINSFKNKKTCKL